MEDHEDGPSRKRIKLSNANEVRDDESTEDESTQDEDESTEGEASEDEAPKDTKLPRTFTRSISPPPLRRTIQPEKAPDSIPKPKQPPKLVNSPFQLTSIHGLSEFSNRDTVTLKSILGSPVISECWNFNYLHNLDFLMEAFDSDVRHLVKINVVHGFWKQEDEARLSLQVLCCSSHSCRCIELSTFASSLLCQISRLSAQHHHFLPMPAFHYSS